MIIDTAAKASLVRRVAERHRGAITVKVVPNRARNIGLLLTILQDTALEGCDVLGRVHGKCSTATDGEMGERWCEFLWDNLVGRADPMLDTTAQVFDARPEIGIVWAKNAHLVGWNENRALAEQLASRLGIDAALSTFFDFPSGVMFYARLAGGRPSVAEFGSRLRRYAGGARGL